VPKPDNEPVLPFAPGSAERESLKARLSELKSEKIEIPLIIGGKEIKTGNTGTCVCPHDHQHVLATYHKAGEKEIKMAVEAAKKAAPAWAAMPWEDRAAIFLRAAELLAGPWRDTLNASTMLNQSKNVYQAEIDAACELIDFLRFNPYYMQSIYEEQPTYSPEGMWNRVEYRPLEGFIFAVTPFNFTSICGNLPTSPAMMGNVVLWKPASSAVYSPYFFMKLLEEAGLPPGVVNFIPCPGREVGPSVLVHPDLAGIHFTGSTETFQNMWKTIGDNIKTYRSYPRIVGETGGKDFIFAHRSADVRRLVIAIIRAAFEYQGQKCSACSRTYIPESLWPEVKKQLVAELEKIKMGDVEDFRNFMNAVIDKASFDNIRSYIDYARGTGDTEFIFGGGYDDSKGYFVEPTVIRTTEPHHKLMEEEIFGPVLTVYVYPDDAYEETLDLCDKTSPYALTGAVFANEREAVLVADRKLVNAAGNFYINDKCTAAVVGQQPFGGGRASGTNDKAGSYLNLIRWTTPRTIKETFVAPTAFEYPFMGAE
jgi:1-pyrroline-5-carboxylate dehydrogenase